MNSVRNACALVLASAGAFVSLSALAASPGPTAAEGRVDALMAKLIQREKILLMSGGSSFGTASLPRVGVPALNFADGPNGVRSNDDEPATVFPTGVGVAATWNPDVAQKMGAAIGEEARSLGVHVLLGPNVNIQRTPLAGRNFEAYSEDPYLSGRIGTGFVRGVQSQGVGTSPKHFVGNEQELERLRSSSNIDERTLREIYLTPFEMIVRDAKPWTVMAAYNRVNGTYMTEHTPLLRGVLKGEWGFDGVLMSDWGAVHTTAEAANGGTDLEMPGPPRYFGAALFQAMRNWTVEQPVVDDAARRMLRLAERTGALDNAPVKKKPGERRASGFEKHRTVAQQVAEEAVVLLRNERDVLPLDRAKVKKLAVIGPNADIPLQQGGGSAAVVPGVLATPLERLRETAGASVAIRYAQGVDNDLTPPPIDHRLLSTDRGRGTSGLKTTYWEGDKLSGTPVFSGVETYFDKTMFASEMTQMAARYDGFFWAPRDGEYEFRLAARGLGTLWLDGKEIIGRNAGTALAVESDFQAAGRVARIKLRKGRSYPLRIDYVSAPVSFHQMHFGVRLPEPDFAEAIAAAKEADAAVVFVGVSRTSESEGRDRDSMDMVGRQSELVEAVLAANPNTIVVLNNGAPLTVPVGRARAWPARRVVAGPGRRRCDRARAVRRSEPVGQAAVHVPAPHRGHADLDELQRRPRCELRRRRVRRLSLLRPPQDRAAVPVRPRAVVHEIRVLGSQGRGHRSTRAPSRWKSRCATPASARAPKWCSSISATRRPPTSRVRRGSSRASRKCSSRRARAVA